GDVFEDDLAWKSASCLCDGGQRCGSAELHFGFESLLEHLLAQPGGDFRASSGGGKMMRQFGGNQIAEMSRDFWKPFSPAGVRNPANTFRATQVTRDDFGVRF